MLGLEPGGVAEEERFEETPGGHGLLVPLNPHNVWLIAPEAKGGCKIDTESLWILWRVKVKDSTRMQTASWTTDDLPVPVSPTMT